MCQSSTMRLRYGIIILIIMVGHQGKSSYATIEVHGMSVENEIPVNALPLKKNEKMKVRNDQKLVVRLPSITLLKYATYKDVSILHFRVPPDTRAAFFKFKAIEEQKSIFQRKCKNRNVTIHLKASSYPVISPENITFPKNFLRSDERYKIYSRQFQSNNKPEVVVVHGPQVGNWFAVAFISWTDPNNDRIEQQGLAASCETLLLAEMSVSHFYPIFITDGQVRNDSLTIFAHPHQIKNLGVNSSQSSDKSQADITGNNCSSSVILPNSHQETRPEEITRTVNQQPTTAQAGSVVCSNSMLESKDGIDKNDKKINSKKSAKKQNENIYKFYVLRDVDTATARISFSELCEFCPDVRFAVQANAYPGAERLHSERGYERTYIYTTVIKPNKTDEISIELYVQPNTWHYAIVQFVDKDRNIEQWQSNIHMDPEGFTEIRVLTLSYHLQIDFQQTLDDEHKRAPVSDTTNPWQPFRFHGTELYALLRQTYREFFTFDYDLEPDLNGTVPGLLNLTAGIPAGFTFNLGEVYDIGGTLTFVVSMNHSSKSYIERQASPLTIFSASERISILADRLVGTRNSVYIKEFLRSIIICMHLGEPGIPTWPDKCRYGQQLMPATSIINNTGSNTSIGLIHVPFPESGQWYITMGLYCHSADTAHATTIDSVKEIIYQYAHILSNIRAPCACLDSSTSYKACIDSHSCLVGMNETETLKIKECMMDIKCTPDYAEMMRRFNIHHKTITKLSAVDECYDSVVFSISSSPCVSGRCSRFGHCYHYMSGGFVFSTCVCMKGFRGWDCTEFSQVSSRTSILLALLLLTLSNLLFIPSIYMAQRRRYYTEAIIYFFAMFFSIFYHACDSGEDKYSFCLTKISVLQFSDFYCGILAIWVTLVAMANIRSQFVSLLHMFGAVLLAFGTELNKHSLWIFLAPALTGVCLISVSWSIRCIKKRKIFSARNYLSVYMPLGSVLVMVGLVCYVFLQTKQNYHIVHSIWHMVMALSILCLLPSHNSFSVRIDVNL